MTPRAALKRLRAWPPFNRLVTASAHTALSLAGARSEFVIRHLHRVGDVESRLPNGRMLRLWSRADDLVSNQVYWRGWTGYEPETVPLFYLLATRSQVTLDIGAYVGFFTLLAAHANPAGRVYAFEPLPEAFSRLKENVERNGLTNVVCENAAAGREDGQADFFHESADALQKVASDARSSISCVSSLSQRFLAPESVVSMRVVVMKLDSSLAARKVERVDLIKIDTESTEPDVLEGALGLLRSSRPAIFCEVLPGGGTERRLEELLFPLGFRAFHLTPRGPELRDQIQSHPVWLNYLFTVRGAEEVAALHREARRLAGLGPGPS